jgi:hypothetical protein
MEITTTAIKIFLHRVEKNKLLDAIATRRNARNHQQRRRSSDDTTNNESAVQGMKESDGAHGVVFFLLFYHAVTS